MGQTNSQVQYYIVKYTNRKVENQSKTFTVLFKPVVKNKNIEFVVDTPFKWRQKLNPFLPIRNTLNLKDQKVVVLELEIINARNDFSLGFDFVLADVFDGLNLDGKNEKVIESKIEFYIPPKSNGTIRGDVYQLNRRTNEDFIVTYAGFEDVMLKDAAYANKNEEKDKLFDENHPLIDFLDKFENNIIENEELKYRKLASEKKGKYRIVSPEILQKTRNLYKGLALQNTVYTTFEDTNLYMKLNVENTQQLNETHLNDCLRSKDSPPIISLTYKIRYLIVEKGKVNNFNIQKEKLNNENENY